MLDAGFLRTMYNMIAVAADKPYLHNVSNDDGITRFVPEKEKKKVSHCAAYHVKMYCA